MTPRSQRPFPVPYAFSKHNQRHFQEQIRQLQLIVEQLNDSTVELVDVGFLSLQAQAPRHGERQDTVEQRLNSLSTGHKDYGRLVGVVKTQMV